MADGTRAQAIRGLEDCYKKLKETSENHSTELKELIRMVTTLNLKFDQSAEKSKAIVAPIEVGGLIPTKPRTGFAPATLHVHTKYPIKLSREKIRKGGSTSAKDFSNTTRC